MKTTELRPFPLSRTILLRSSFFALAKIGAELNSYDEAQGIITARIARMEIGEIKILGEEDIEISIEERDTTSFLKITAPKNKLPDLLRLISTYCVDGSKAIKDDAHFQWVNLLKDEESRRKRNEKINSFISKITFQQPKNDQKALPQENGIEYNHSTNSEVIEYANLNSDNSQIAAIPVSETPTIRTVDPSKLELVVPPYPGMLIKNRTGQIFEIQVDAMIFFDRATHLLVCPYCSATNLQGSWFCSRCGKPQNIKATIEEIKKKIVASADESLKFALIGLVPIILFFALLASPLSTNALKAAASVTLVLIIGQQSIATILLLSIFVALPIFLLGRKAITSAQNALNHLNLSFYTDKSGKTKANLGQAIGYFEIFVAITIVILAILNSYLI
jgi:hypothetical protein